MILGSGFNPTKAGLTSKDQLPALFQATILPSHSPISECDYNLHKSNSTYFSDLDAARTHLVCALAHTAIKRLQNEPGLIIAPDGTPAKGRWSIMLGAVHCGFKREIKPYEGYEMWSRLLCWDRKWVYVVTHFVKKGAVKPASWTVDDPADMGFLSSIFRRKAARKAATAGGVAGAETVPENVIFASAISKYVMKMGRLTIHPEAVLDLSGLLPPKPGGWNTMDKAPIVQDEEEEGLEENILTTIGIPNGKENGSANGSANGYANGTANGHANGAVEAETGWDWKMIEAENAKGLEFAAHHHALDSLPETFTGNKEPALGYYPDLI